MSSTTLHPDIHHAQTAVPGLISLIDKDVIRRAAIIALFLGTILTVTNQPDAIFGDAPVQLLPLILVYLTPFVVVTISQVLGVRRALRDAVQSRAFGSVRDAFVTTALSHGIPLRAVLLGLLVGTVNTSVVVSAALMEGGNLANLPIAVIGQAFVLPMLFGLLSQAISYRRAAVTIRRRREPAMQPVTV